MTSLGFVHLPAFSMIPPKESAIAATPRGFRLRAAKKKIAITTGQPAQEARVTEEQIQEIVDRAIRHHELRVALWSGLLGAAIMAGTWHAIWLVR
jgi:hypothetical protein